MSTVKTVATVLVGLVVLGGGGAYLWSNSSSSENKENNITTTTKSTTKSTESTTRTTSEGTTTKANQPQTVATTVQQGASPSQPVTPVETTRTTVILGKSYTIYPGEKMASADRLEIYQRQAEIDRQKQAGQQVDLPNTAEIPMLTPDQPIAITYANIRNANSGWQLKVKGVIEAHLGKPLSSATNREIQTAVTSIASRNGFIEAVKTPVTP